MQTVQSCDPFHAHPIPYSLTNRHWSVSLNSAWTPMHDNHSGLFPHNVMITCVLPVLPLHVTRKSHIYRYAWQTCTRTDKATHHTAPLTCKPHSASCARGGVASVCNWGQTSDGTGRRYTACNETGSACLATLNNKWGVVNKSQLNHNMNRKSTQLRLPVDMHPSLTDGGACGHEPCELVQ